MYEFVKVKTCVDFIRNERGKRDKNVHKKTCGPILSFIAIHLPRETKGG